MSATGRNRPRNDQPADDRRTVAPASRANRTIPRSALLGVAVARISNAVAALTTPLRTGSPTARSTCNGSPVSADSSRTATAPSIRPSTGPLRRGRPPADHGYEPRPAAPPRSRHRSGAARNGRTLQQGPQVVRGAPLCGSIQGAPRGQHHRDQRTATYSPTKASPPATTPPADPPGPTPVQRHTPTPPRAPLRTAFRHPTPVGHRTAPDEPRDPAQQQRGHRHHHQSGLEQGPKPLQRRSGRRRRGGHRPLRPSTSAPTTFSSILPACSGVAPSHHTAALENGDSDTTVAEGLGSSNGHVDPLWHHSSSGIGRWRIWRRCIRRSNEYWP